MTESKQDKEIVLRKKGELSSTHSSELNILEKIQVSFEKANAIGRIRMTIADYLIEEGLIKRRRKK